MNCIAKDLISTWQLFDRSHYKPLYVLNVGVHLAKRKIKIH